MHSFDTIEQCAPETFHPVQFQRLWKGSGPWGSAQKVALAILEQAVEDLGRSGATRPTSRRLFSQAYTWLTSYDRSHFFSFANVCDTLNLDGDAVRERLLKDLWNATLAQDELGRSREPLP